MFMECHATRLERLASSRHHGAQHGQECDRKNGSPEKFCCDAPCPIISGESTLKSLDGEDRNGEHPHLSVRKRKDLGRGCEWNRAFRLERAMVGTFARLPLGMEKQIQEVRRIHAILGEVNKRRLHHPNVSITCHPTNK